MFELTLENAAGDQLKFGAGTPFTITEIDGLNPPSATINTSQIALMDGARYNSAKVNMRQINVAFAIEIDAPLNRINVYKVLKSKQYIKLYYKGDYRNVYIEGYISSIDITYFDMKQICTCGILCPSPFFKDAQEMVNELSTIIGAFHFPFASTEEPQLVFGYIDRSASATVINDGDVDCGMLIDLYARSAVSDPKIFNYITGEFFGVQYSMQAGDLITIDTRQGQKSVKLLRDGQYTNIFNYIMQNSTWLQLPAGGGVFVYEVGSGSDTIDLVVTFNHNNLYEGV